MYSKIVEQFCTPIPLPISESEKKAISSAEFFTVPFEGYELNCYSWGEGKTVLLVHGWSSRASHMVLMAKYLAGFGFRVVAFDAPAHYSTKNNIKKKTSNMFEFGKTVSTVVQHLGNVYAVIGHSLGAAASGFASAGSGHLAGYNYDVNKLVLISSPSSLISILRNFCHRNNFGENDFNKLWQGLESEFNMSIDKYSLGETLAETKSEILLIHDKDDEEFALNEALNICSNSNNVRLFVTKKYGHYKVLLSRKVFKEVKNFLTCY